jgi:hypothetical protein
LNVDIFKSKYSRQTKGPPTASLYYHGFQADYIEKEAPQPQPEVALGLLT